jgi:monoamine oxidase
VHYARAMVNLTSDPSPDPEASRRVIVVGAGLAGLAAALHAGDAGWNVLVIEARPRVGGRVHTQYGGVDGVPFDRGLHAELGGESIDDSHTALLGLLRRFAIPTERRPGSTSDRARSGRYRYRDRTYTFGELTAQRDGVVLSDFLRIDDELMRLAESHEVDPEHPESARRAADLDGQSFAAWLDTLHLSPEARFVAEHSNASLYNAELEDLSMLFVVQQVAATSGIPTAASETMRVAGGNATLPRAIAAELGSALIVDAPVTSVRTHGDGVSVVARGRSYFGAHLIVALPPPPLREVQFDPPLPARIAAAIDGLDLGAATKVVNQFDSAFWRSDGQSGFSLSDLTYRVSWDAADSYAAPAGLLTTYTTAGNGRALAALDDATRIDRVRMQLAEVFPESTSQLSGPAVTVAWTNEQFTGGGYAVYRPGQVTAFWEPLRTGTDRVHFAGEHLEAPAGYMESAVRSGIRAAGRLPRV